MLQKLRGLLGPSRQGVVGAHGEPRLFAPTGLITRRQFADLCQRDPLKGVKCPGALQPTPGRQRSRGGLDNRARRESPDLSARVKDRRGPFNKEITLILAVLYSSH